MVAQEMYSYQQQVILAYNTIISSYLITMKGSSWSQTSLPNGAWLSIVVDSTGTNLAAVQSQGYIWTSTSG